MPDATDLPHMLVCELLSTELASIKVPPRMDVPVLPHVVHGGVVLAAVHADDPLLSCRP